MKQSRLYYITPFIIAAVVVLIAIIISGLNVLFLIFYLPVLFGLLGIDWVIKLITDNTLYIWLIEIILIVIALIWFPPTGFGVC